LRYSLRRLLEGLGFVIVAVLALVLANNTRSLSRSQQTGTGPNTLSGAEKKDGWKLLFDGKTFTGWRGYTNPGFPDKGWSIEDGCLKVAKNTGRPGSGGGDIVTTAQFTDFDLRFEWRIAPGGNSGIKYFVLERQGEPGAK